MSKKFEQLIEYVINDDEQKARELFHEIVVEKSREIYESLMDDEFGGETADLVTDINADEQGDLSGDEDEYGDEFGDDETSDEFGDDETSDEVADLEDRVVDLEDQLDELMAEFDALTAGDEGDEFGDEEEFKAEGLSEEVKLTPVAKPSNADTADNKRSVGLQNSGKGGVKSGGAPVKTDTTAETGRSAPSAKAAGVAGPQDAARGAFKSKAPAAAKNEPAGTVTKSVVRK